MEILLKMYEQAGLPKPNVFNCQAFLVTVAETENRNKP